MKQVDVAFVVLTYRNDVDLQNFINSAKKTICDMEYKIIVVNSFYDRDSEENIKEIALRNDCDFFSIENKGYSYGNNRGIEYVNLKYEYEYLVISNPDIVLERFSIKELEKFKGKIIGPKIINAKGKQQNPLLYMKNPISMRLIYLGFKRDVVLLLKTGTAINRIQREICKYIAMINKKTSYKVYALHGSFVIFSRAALKKIGHPYDENMFLFGEESVLADVAEKNGIESFVCENLKVLHKEDGSMNFEKEHVYMNLKNANIYYYEHYRS